MASNVPPHIQQQILSTIRILHDNVGQEAARAYLKSLCNDTSLDMLLGPNHRSQSPSERQHTGASSQMEEDIWRTFTFLDEDPMTDCITISDPAYPTVTCTGPDSSQVSDGLKDDLLTMTSLNADIPRPVTSPAAPSLETFSPPSSLPSSAESEFTTLCQACTCERCTKRKMCKKRADGPNNSPDTVIRGFLRPRLLEFLSDYWETLKVNGLYYHESAQSFQWTLDNSPAHVRRLHYHVILDHLGIEDDLYQWRRSIAEINNLNGYRAFFAEAEGETKQRQRTRWTGETNSQKAHKEYLAHIYADRTPKDFHKAKQALKKNLEFGRRWSILVDSYVGEGDVVVPGLGPGVLLLCGPSVKKKMSFPILLEDHTLTET